MCVWEIEVHKLSGKPHLRSRGGIVAAQLMPIDRTFKEQWLYFTDYFILPLQQAIPIYSVIQLSIFFFLTPSLSRFLPVSFLNCLCPWKSFSNLSTSTLHQHALLSDDICISYNSSHLSWNPTPAPMFNKFNGTLWLPLKPFLAPCPNTLNTNFQTWIYFGDLIGFSFSLPPGDINFKPWQAQVQLLLLQLPPTLLTPLYLLKHHIKSLMARVWKTEC